MSDKAIQLVQDSFDRAYTVQSPRNDIYLRAWQRYKGYNPNISDPYKTNIVMPKLYSTIETITPRLGKALFGRRPYIPIKNDKVPDAVEPIELALDEYLHRDGFKVTGKRALKCIALFGTAFLEPYPAQVIEIEKKMMISPEYPWQPITVEEKTRKFALKTRLWMPWQVYVEPNMKDINDCGWVITIDVVSKEQIRKMQEIGRFKRGELKNLSDAGGESESKTNFAKTMIQGLGISAPTVNENYGILMRWMSDDRYVTTWNGLQILEDRDNPYKHQKKNIVKFAYNEDPMLQNSFWGQGEGKTLEAICDKLDETWNQAFNNHDLINEAVFGYREDAVNPDTIVMVGGVRIPIASGFSGDLKNALQKFDIQGLPADFYQIPGVLDMWADRASGVFDIQRGEPDDEDGKTATEASLLNSQGDIRSEERVELLEAMGMRDFADKALSHIDQFTTFDDIYDIVGDEALNLVTMNPQELPGSSDYQFKGSDSIVNDFQKAAEAREMLETLGQSPVMRPGWNERNFLQSKGFTDKEIDEAVFTDEELMMQQQQQMMMQQQQADQEFERDMVKTKMGAAPAKKAKVPTVQNPGG